MPTAEVEILDTWYTLGMRGTDSNDAVFANVLVPTRRTFVLDPGLPLGRHFQGPLYRFPAVGIIALFTGGVLLATARNAITEFRELAARKTPFGSMKTLRDRGAVQAALAEAEGMLRAGRAFFYEAMTDAWARAVAGLPNTLEQRADLLLAAIQASKGAVGAVDIIHRLAGTTGIYSRSTLDRFFRDAHTLRHHDDARQRSIDARLPRPGGGYALPVLHLARLLAEVPDVPLGILREPVERVFGQVSLEENLIVHDRDCHAEDRLRLARDFNGVRLHAVGRLGPVLERGAGDERIVGIVDDSDELACAGERWHRYLCGVRPVRQQGGWTRRVGLAACARQECQGGYRR